MRQRVAEVADERGLAGRSHVDADAGGGAAGRVLPVGSDEKASLDRLTGARLDEHAVALTANLFQFCGKAHHPGTVGDRLQGAKQRLVRYVVAEGITIHLRRIEADLGSTDQPAGRVNDADRAERLRQGRHIVPYAGGPQRVDRCAEEGRRPPVRSARRRKQRHTPARFGQATRRKKAGEAAANNDEVGFPRRPRHNDDPANDARAARSLSTIDAPQDPASIDTAKTAT